MFAELKRMPLLVGGVICALSLVAAIEAHAANDGHDRSVMITNQSSLEVVELYGSSETTDDWEDDILARGTLPSNESLVVDFFDGSNDCIFDLRLVFDDGSFIEEYGFDVCQEVEFIADEDDRISMQQIPVPENLPTAPIAELETYAMAFLDGIQESSFNEGREFCGFFVETADGNVIGTPPTMGSVDTCYYADTPSNAVATYHTHGSYSHGHVSEIPSDVDAISAVEFELDDYVSTPGGRFWRVDGGTGDVHMICGQSCVLKDPAYVNDNSYHIEQTYTLRELEEFFGSSS